MRYAISSVRFRWQFFCTLLISKSELVSYFHVWATIISCSSDLPQISWAPPARETWGNFQNWHLRVDWGLTEGGCSTVKVLCVRSLTEKIQDWKPGKNNQNHRSIFCARFVRQKSTAKRKSRNIQRNVQKCKLSSTQVASKNTSRAKMRWEDG